MEAAIHEVYKVSARFMKLVKGVRRGRIIGRKFRREFLWMLLGFGVLLFGSAHRAASIRIGK
jgi:hypothetical protein